MIRSVYAEWERVSAALADNVRPISFDPDSGALHVHTVSAAWAAQLQLLAPLLITRLNDQLSRVQVRRIRVHVPDIPPPVVCGADAGTPPKLMAALSRQRQDTAREPEGRLGEDREPQQHRSRQQAGQRSAATVYYQALIRARQLGSAVRITPPSPRPRPGELPHSNHQQRSTGGEA
ncbi:DciA family protein [Streptomyces sp. ASQP_92]|uniref:DciA family protein n=1 Tax=Streptomyces sp. ASQP_92 TaxID=2979116 RepID=UPI0037D9929A